MTVLLGPRLASLSQVGLAACQVGKALGLTVVGTAGTAEGEQLVRDVGGADFVFNHKSKNYLTEMQARTFIARFKLPLCSYSYT